MDIKKITEKTEKKIEDIVFSVDKKLSDVAKEENVKKITEKTNKVLGKTIIEVEKAIDKTTDKIKELSESESAKKIEHKVSKKYEEYKKVAKNAARPAGISFPGEDKEVARNIAKGILGTIAVIRKATNDVTDEVKSKINPK